MVREVAPAAPRLLVKVRLRAAAGGAGAGVIPERSSTIEVWSKKSTAITSDISAS